MYKMELFRCRWGWSDSCPSHRPMGSGIGLVLLLFAESSCQLALNASIGCEALDKKEQAVRTARCRSDCCPTSYWLWDIGRELVLRLGCAWFSWLLGACTRVHVRGSAISLRQGKMLSWLLGMTFLTVLELLLLDYRWCLVLLRGWGSHCWGSVVSGLLLDLMKVLLVEDRDW